MTWSLPADTACHCQILFPRNSYSWIQTFPACYLFQGFQPSGVQGHPVLNLPSLMPRGHLLGRRPLRLTWPRRAAFPPLHDPKHTLAPSKAKPVHSRARSKKSRSGRPQLPFPLQKLCKIFRPWKHFLPTQGIFRLMVHQTSQSRKP